VPPAGAQAVPPPFPPAQPPFGQMQPGRGAGRRGAGDGRQWRGPATHATPRTPTGPTVQLPTPRAKSDTSIEQALWSRRSLRSATKGQITLQDVNQLAWAAQGITGEWGRRAAPSAGAGYPLEVIIVAGDVDKLPAGVYRYYPVTNELERLAEGDHRKELASVCNFRDVEKAPAVVVISAVESRMNGLVQPAMTRQTIAIEAGAASQNLALEAVALGLGTAVVADTNEGKLDRIVHLAPDEKPFVVVVISRQ